VPNRRDAKKNLNNMGLGSARPLGIDLEAHPKFAIAQLLCGAQKLSKCAQKCASNATAPDVCS
jgi:hypothetical protein